MIYTVWIQIKQEDDAGEKPGPLNIALLFTRKEGEKDQRIVIFGDGDFISNAYLGNGANLNLGLNLVRWLSGDEKLLDIPAKTAPDLTLELSQFAGTAIAITLLILMPLGLFGTGFYIWWRRRNQ